MPENSIYTVRLMTAAKRDINDAKMSMKQAYGAMQAARMLQRMQSDLDILKSAPFSIQKVDDHRLHSLGYRCLPIDNGNKIVFYVVYKQKKLVQVRRILSSRQDYLAILFRDHPRRSRK